MYLTNESYNDLKDRTGRADAELNNLLKLGESWGLSYRHTPVADIIKQYGSNTSISLESTELRHPEKYQHEYFFMVPLKDTVIEHHGEVTPDKALLNILGHTNSLYYWSYDLVSLLIKFYKAPMAANETSFYVIPADRLYSLHQHHQLDLLDNTSETELHEIFGVLKISDDKYDVLNEGAIFTDCIPAGALPYNLGILGYTMLICMLGKAYGMQDKYTVYYDMFRHAMEYAHVRIYNFEHIFKDAAYNLPQYSFPVEHTFEPFISGETRYKERLTYLQEAYRAFADCNNVNALFKNAVRQYAYTEAEILDYMRSTNIEPYFMGLNYLNAKEV